MTHSSRRTRWMTFLLLTMAGGLLLNACSSDDDPVTPGPAGPGDTIAPIVAEFEPGIWAINIPLAAEVNVRFSEPMATETAAGNVQLSAGTIDGLTWVEENTLLVVSVSGLSEAEKVTLSVGTGLQDVAGNALPQEFSTIFFTTSGEPVMMEYDLHADAAEVPCNVRVLFRFSHPMDLSSLNGATILSDGAANPECRFGTLDVDFSRVVIFPTFPLDPATTYTLDISTAAQTQGGVNLSAPVHLEFTTSAAVDDVPPTILATEPANGSTASRDIDRVVVTFSESVDPASVVPDTLSGFFILNGLGDPVWNDATDEMTLYLGGPLPAGVDLFAVFDTETIRDWSYNYNADPQTLRFTIEGEPDLFPVEPDLALIFGMVDEGSDQGGSWDYSGPGLVVFDKGTGSSFKRLVYHETESGFTELADNWLMRKPADGEIILDGFVDGSATTRFDPGVPLLPADQPGTWTGTAVMTRGQETAYFSYEGTVVARDQDYRWWSDDGFSGTFLVLENVVNVEINRQVTLDQQGEELLVEGQEIMYFCPGIGLFNGSNEENYYDGGVVVGDGYSEYWLEEVGRRADFQ
ncbi:MAG: Ig-like domain-containing protein [Candidatus Krumholzibacteriota bacterium]